MIKSECDINALNAKINEKTPLMIACEKGELYFSDKLTRAGASVNIKV